MKIDIILMLDVIMIIRVVYSLYIHYIFIIYSLSIHYLFILFFVIIRV